MKISIMFPFQLGGVEITTFQDNYLYYMYKFHEIHINNLFLVELQGPQHMQQLGCQHRTSSPVRPLAGGYQMGLSENVGYIPNEIAI